MHFLPKAWFHGRKQCFNLQLWLALKERQMPKSTTFWDSNSSPSQVLLPWVNGVNSPWQKTARTWLSGWVKITQEQTVYPLSSCPKSLNREDVKISENRTYFKHTNRLLHIILVEVKKFESPISPIKSREFYHKFDSFIYILGYYKPSLEVSLFSILRLHFKRKHGVLRGLMSETLDLQKIRNNHRQVSGSGFAGSSQWCLLNCLQSFSTIFLKSNTIEVRYSPEVLPTVVQT